MLDLEDAMTGKTDDADFAADRLDAALERLAALTGTLRSAPDAETSSPAPANSAAAEEIANRLDRLIDTLRAEASDQRIEPITPAAFTARACDDGRDRVGGDLAESAHVGRSADK